MCVALDFACNKGDCVGLATVVLISVVAWLIFHMFST